MQASNRNSVEKIRKSHQKDEYRRTDEKRNKRKAPRRDKREQQNDE